MSRQLESAGIDETGAVLAVVAGDGFGHFAEVFHHVALTRSAFVAAHPPAGAAGADFDPLAQIDAAPQVSAGVGTTLRVSGDLAIRSDGDFEFES